MDAIELSLFTSRMQSICDEMGATLQHTAFSPNIRDRLDFSCAIFDADGQLCAQAAHIPVHLGSMAFAMQSIVSQFDWQEGDCLILNDPFRGGTHLPDITFISPVLLQGQLYGFVANRAHHANIGSETPGSMPIASHIDEEGLLIEPTFLYRQFQPVDAIWHQLEHKLQGSAQLRADFHAQLSANKTGIRRLTDLILMMKDHSYTDALLQLNDSAETMARSGLSSIPNGCYSFTDVMDDDGQGNQDIPVSASITIKNASVKIDFSGTANQVSGNINCPLSVTAAAVYYCFFCLMPETTPACAGAFRNIRIHASPGSLVNAQFPAAVAAGNVETSSRIVDVIFGALAQALPERIPAASQGSMNNVAMGSTEWDYYETLAGGMGAGRNGGGLDAVHTHMTNTSNTPIEILELHYPLRIHQYVIRKNSSGTGNRAGGNGLTREYYFLQETSVSLLGERRLHAPWGSQGGADASSGENRLNDKIIPGKYTFKARAGDVLRINTPGGGGWGNS